MSTPLPLNSSDLLGTVGFQKGKIGAGDKEVGYTVKEDSLHRIAGSVGLLVFCMVGLSIWLNYEVSFTKRIDHSALRHYQHHAASKLTRTHMELWAQYHEDIKESREAKHLLNTLKTSYDGFHDIVDGIIKLSAKNLGLQEAVANKFADEIMHAVAEHQMENMKHVKSLVDHLVLAGKKSVALEKQEEDIAAKEMREEERLSDEDSGTVHVHTPLQPPPPHGGLRAAADTTTTPLMESDDEDMELHTMIGAIFDVFHEYEKEFPGDAKDNLNEDSHQYKELEALFTKINSDDPPEEDEIIKGLDAIDLSSVGAALGAGRILPAADIVEELLMIQKVPRKKLQDLEKSWKSKDMKAQEALNQIIEWHKEGLIPTGWLSSGVNKEVGEDLGEVGLLDSPIEA